MLIYKILLSAEWAEFEASGTFDGSPFDRSSGFVHCSSRAQVADVARRLFAEDQEFVVVALDARPLGRAVRWEQSPDGGSYPHVYAQLPRAAVVAVHRVPRASLVDDIVPREAPTT